MTGRFGDGANAGRPFGSRWPGDPRLRGSADLMRQIQPQLAHRVRAARLGQHLHRAALQRLERGPAGGLASELITITGRGWKCISFFRNVRPSMRGISMSSVSTSGCRAQDFVARHIGIRRRSDHLDVRLTPPAPR